VSYESYIGRTEERTDTVTRPLARALAATFDREVPEPQELPALWHWALFQHWEAGKTLGPDGHPRRGAFLPDAPGYPRRMWAGGQLKFQRGLRIGQQLNRRSRIIKASEKEGTTGISLWVSLEHVLTDDQGLLLSEQQDLVYRTAGSPPAPAAAPPESPPGAVSEQVSIDAVLLFRYSALTGNSHRIHYDQEYARMREGYESLLVHGALQASLLAALAQRQEPGRPLRQFVFRARRPALLHRCPLLLEAWPLADRWQLRSRDCDGSVCMTAEAEFENEVAVARGS
jgi:3-methylfumaryl-CoA hydratase